ncbi:hypothetical protein IFM89_021838 [Coptis chinensis]|uniref:Uncharacterized protein n=1 Tax=Coptis chinensis TaxID=261450 RepID=A0A835I520_9MAGN|nr:hypothetical protein IFM89_021838 [Coptis chinensis]
MVVAGTLSLSLLHAKNQVAMNPINTVYVKGPCHMLDRHRRRTSCYGTDVQRLPYEEMWNWIIMDKWVEKHALHWVGSTHYGDQSEEFGGNCDFDVDDAVQKLEKMGVVAFGLTEEHKLAPQVSDIASPSSSEDLEAGTWEVSKAKLRPLFANNIQLGVGT